MPYSEGHKADVAEILSGYDGGIRNFSGWTVTGGLFVKEIIEGCNFDRSHFRECTGALSKFVNASFEGAEFSHCSFAGVDFHSSYLGHSSFTNCVLDRSDFYMSTLNSSHFDNTSLRNCCFLRTKLTNCNISRTSLSGSLFGRTTLTAMTLLGVDFKDSVVALPHEMTKAELKLLHGIAYALNSFAFGGTTQSRADDTRPADSTSAKFSINPELARSLCSQLPALVDFLERGGIAPDQLVPLANVAELTTQYSGGSIFLSYATEDERFAQQLFQLLTRAGLDVWFAPENMRGGQKLTDQLMREIDKRDQIVLVVSPSSMASGWVETEIRRALTSTDQMTRRRVVPVLLIDDDQWHSWKLFDQDTGRDLAHEMRAGNAYSFADCETQGEKLEVTLRAMLRELAPAGERSDDATRASNHSGTRRDES
jgi:uncharacterized protein YjbI with pentapeptide repeats